METPENKSSLNENIVPDSVEDKTEISSETAEKKENGSEQPKQEKTKKEKRNVSIPLCIICCLLVGVFVFLLTYQIMITSAKKEVLAVREEYEVYDKLLNVKDLYDLHYLYDVDKDSVNTALAKAYAIASGDRYVSYYTAEEWDEFIHQTYGDSVGIGSYIQQNPNGNIMVAKVMRNSPAERGGLQDGDEIYSVDGIILETIARGSAAPLLLGEDGSKVVFGVIRNGEKLTVEVTRGHYEQQTVYAEIITVDGVEYGYIKIVKFQKVTANQFLAAMQALLRENVKGFLFDVRDNPGGDAEAIGTILDFLLPEGVIYSLYDTNNNLLDQRKSSPGELNLPMTVLTNGNTASAAELFTCALRDYDKADIVGMQTYGKGCGQNAFAMESGDVVFITSFLYNPPKSPNYDKVGIKPDIEIKIDPKWSKTNLFLVPHEEDAQLLAGLDNLIAKTK